MSKNVKISEIDVGPLKQVSVDLHTDASRDRFIRPDKLASEPFKGNAAAEPALPALRELREDLTKIGAL